MTGLRKQVLALLLLFCIFMSFYALVPHQASADDFVISKVLTTISATPVALMDPAMIAAATSTPGCYIAAAAWFDAAGNMALGAFNIETYQLRIVVGAMDGYFIDPGAACYLNNSAVTAIPDGTGKSVTLIREYTAAAWAPTIFKQPGNETVREYGFASFVVSGSYVRDYQWMLVNPTATDYIPIDSLKSRFPNMDSTGNGSEKLMLYNIPYELNGWNVVCNFVGAGNGNDVLSQPAVLTVIPDPSRTAATPTPLIQPTPTPDLSPSPEPVQSGIEAGAAEMPEPSAEPEVHEHRFSETWYRDADSHWHECPDDGERSDLAPHSFTWTETLAATTKQHGEERGVCDVCGYTATRQTDILVRQPFSFPSPLMSLLLLLIPLDLILLIVHAAVISGKRRRAARRRSRR